MEAQTLDKIAVIINPNIGNRMVNRVKSLVEHELRGLPTHIIIWQETPTCESEIDRFIREEAKTVVSVGGDGTMNFLASKVVNTNKSLAILPLGSGNGLARHLGIPLKLKKALQLVKTGKVKTIDCGVLNNKHHFFCATGIGYDAKIIEHFDDSDVRGLFTYVRLTLQLLANYRSEEYEVIIDEEILFTKKAFIIGILNANQYGNNAFMAPRASTTDGLLNVCILKPFSFWHIPMIALRLFTKTIHFSKHWEGHFASKVVIRRKQEGSIHYDGELGFESMSLTYQAVPSSLNILIP